MTFSFDFLYGMAFGLLLADEESCSEEGIAWGLVLLLGPIMILIEKDA